MFSKYSFASSQLLLLVYATISFDFGVSGVEKSSGYKSPRVLFSQT